MNKRLLILVFCALMSTAVFSQRKKVEHQQQFVDLGIGLGKDQTSVSSSYIHNWTLGQSGRIFVGTGVRFTTYFGKNINFTSAPAKLASDEKKTDTILAPKPSISALNILISLGYNVSSKLQLGFNIDAVGFSFGPTGKPIFNGVTTSAKPTSGNILLVGNNDKGSLNSHFYARYTFNEKLGIVVGYEYLFTELKTSTKVQTIPEQNDRFRQKASDFYIGLSYKL
jgi:long-subunit fatty acid transport protein